VRQVGDARIPFRIQFEEAKMKCSFLLSGIVGAIALLLTGGAWAASAPLTALQASAQSQPSPVALARYGGHMMGMHVHSAGIAGPHIGHAAMLHAYSSPHMHHLNHHHRRVFLVGVPYYDYPYDYAYADSDCWWSRRYHRWFCPNE
jgi:hypothetical protein